MAGVFQKDLKISIPESTQQKATLQLSPTGDIVLVDGREKLVSQITRALVNEQTALRSTINSRGVELNRNILALITTILRDFRQNQIDETNSTNPNFSGYKIYRKSAGINEAYVPISADPITTKFVDKNLRNGITYSYGVSRIESNVFESSFIDRFSITPTRFSAQQGVVVGSTAIAEAGNQQVTIYVNYNRRFKASELLNKIESITIDPDDADPRRISVQVIVKDLLEDNVSLAVQSISAVTGN